MPICTSVDDQWMLTLAELDVPEHGNYSPHQLTSTMGHCYFV
jgi:hypothetical protein